MIVSHARYSKWKATGCEGALFGLHDRHDTCRICPPTPPERPLRMTVQKSIKFSDGTEIHFCRTEEKPEQPDAVEFYDVDGNRLDICLGDIMRLQDDDQRKHEWYAEIQKRMVDSMRRTAWENGL